MKTFLYCFLCLLSIVFLQPALAEDKIVNVYAWFGEIPEQVIHQFEKETGIKVNFSSYDSNEELYAKLRAIKQPYYDVIEPTCDYIGLMSKQHLLTTLDKTQLSAYHNLNPLLLHRAYDPHSQYSIPLIWGITGIFFNTKYIKPNTIRRWSDLWDPQYHHQLALLDDPRDVFAMALKSLGYSVNDNDPEHIKQAYLKLKALIPNVKTFNNVTAALSIDEDILLGISWNGDLSKARQENPSLGFIYPEEGFVIWAETLAIPKDAPHLHNAYLFLNFLLRPEIAKQIALYTNYATANLTAQKLLPDSIKNNPISYPPKKTLMRGEFQTALSGEAAELYEKYWELLKMEK